MEDISPENYAELEKRYRSTAAIISAMIIGMFVLVAAVWIIPFNIEKSIPPNTLTTLWMAMVFVAVVAFVIRRLFYRWDRLRDITLLKGFAGLLKTLQTKAIILAAFAEIIVIIGLVITALSGEKFEMVRAGIVALIVFLLNFPRKKVWGKIAASMEKI